MSGSKIGSFSFFGSGLCLLNLNPIQPEFDIPLGPKLVEPLCCDLRLI